MSTLSFTLLLPHPNRTYCQCWVCFRQAFIAVCTPLSCWLLLLGDLNPVPRLPGNQLTLCRADHHRGGCCCPAKNVLDNGCVRVYHAALRDLNLNNI
ncbi:hypothetical protein BJY52DRAFT_1299580 [Lactarius psammicola]|nr:hypothetical protein BJY52DRAFT_1299580 [Lactarius psammicola]